MQLADPLIAAALAGLVALTHAVHVGLDSAPLPQPTRLEETLPSPGATRFLALGQHALVADYYYLRSLDHFGDVQFHRAHYPNLEPFLSRVLELDPYHRMAYVFAGTALTLDGMEIRASNALLEKGLIHRPDLWQVPFYLGFNHFYFLQNYPEAARMLARAAKLEGAPEVAGPLATRLSAEAGEPELGIRMIDSMLEGVSDEHLKQTYLERRALLVLEVELAWLRRALERFAAETGKPAKSLDELVRAGLLERVPQDPVGGRYFIDEAGGLQTSSESKRLRVYRERRGKK